MAAWNDGELDAIARAKEIKVAPLRPDGTLSTPTVIWVVRVGDELFVRSWRGPSGSWFRAAESAAAGRISAAGVERDVALVRVANDRINDAVDEAFRQKYGPHSPYVADMVRPAARLTTLRLVPRAGS